MAAGSEIVGMGAEQLNLQIDAKLMRSLEVEAKRQHRSASHLAGEAIEVMLRNCAEKRAAIRAALEEAEAGAFVSEKAMNDWVSSWGTDSETPAPEPDVLPRVWDQRGDRAKLRSTEPPGS